MLRLPGTGGNGLAQGVPEIGIAAARMALTLVKESLTGVYQGTERTMPIR
ncbi:hypothetical protein AWB83_02606 [Caballeronia ptereochthonis]|uniref:Uncharacterized protein n=1 Tax=Caballeronia ptereochthonis TaxID=1777144 RepID=A0A158B0P3_9BURK|nr:hypothetical protein AWB83_02606 [Caballeronia ptereochthonis]